MQNFSVILNLTKHNATDEQKKAGVIDLPSAYQEKLKALLTFNELPQCEEVKKRAREIYDLVIKFCLNRNSPVRDEVKSMITGEIKEDSLYLDEDEFKKLNLAFMIGGALWLMKPLIEELENIGTPLFAFTKRVVEEIKKEDGSVEKKAVFKHEGFVPAC
jgi:hypothetical protein